MFSVGLAGLSLAGGRGKGEPGAAPLWTTLFRDDGTRPMSFGGNLASYDNGSYVGGRFAHTTLEAGVGNYIAHIWEDGYATADPHLVGTRRDDQTYVYNMLSPSIMALGHAPVVRDTATGRTTLRVRQKADLPEGASLTPHAVEARVDGSISGAVLSLRHAVRTVGAARWTIYDIDLPDITSIPEFWVAFWLIQADSHQSTTDATQRTTAITGEHTEADLLELTGYKDFDPTNWMNYLRANLIAYSTVDNSALDEGIPNFGYFDVATNVYSNTFDMQLEFDGVNFYFRWKLSASSTWLTYLTVALPANSRYLTAPLHVQIDAKAGARWEDLSASWVGNATATTAYEWSYGEITIETLTANVGNCHVRAITPSTIPAASASWVVTPSAIDGAAAVGTVLANLTANSGYTYEVYGWTGIGVVGNEIQITDTPANGSGALLIWMIRTADNARFQVGGQAITVSGAPTWYNANAIWQTDETGNRAYIAGTGEVAVSDVYDTTTRALTAAARAAMDRAAYVVLVEGSGMGASYDGILGNDNDRNLFSWQGGETPPKISVKVGGGVDTMAEIGGLTTIADPFCAVFTCDADDIAGCCAMNGFAAAPVARQAGARTQTFTGGFVKGTGWGDESLEAIDGTETVAGDVTGILCIAPEHLGGAAAGAANTSLTDAQLQKAAELGIAGV